MASTARFGLAVFLGVSLWGTHARADIVIEGDAWDKFQAFVEPDDLAQEQLAVPTTVDGRKSLHMTLPFGDKYALYELNVTKMPAGRFRFPVEVEARMVTRRDSGFTIRNMTLDPEEDASLQSSFISIGMSDRGRGGAKDDLQEEDVQESIGTAGERSRDPAGDTTIVPAALTSTVLATLELIPGSNLLRLDTTDPSSLPIYDPQGGYQVFRVTIGLGEPDLEGELVPACTVRRQISPKVYAAGERITVTLTTRNLTGAATITETFPTGWSVAEAGGGTAVDNTIAFETATDGTITYELNAAGNSCALSTFSGSFAGACEGAVDGTSDIDCLHTGGIRITGATFEEFAELGEGTDLLTTEDDRTTLHFDADEDVAIIHVNVTQMPAGKDRFPVAVVTRQTFDNSTSMAIRNLTIDPEPDPVFQASFIAIRLMDNRDAEARDERWLDDMVSGEDPRDLMRRSGTRRDGGEKSTLIYQEGVSRTETATLQLVPGINRLRIDGTDVRDLPEYDPDTNHQIFDIVIGPDETELLFGGFGPGPGPFSRGDCNNDGGVDLSDGVAMLNFTFLGSTEPVCLVTCDFNGDGALDVTTAVFFFNFLFQGGLPLPPPTNCGRGQTPSDVNVGCLDTTQCAEA